MELSEFLNNCIILPSLPDNYKDIAVREESEFFYYWIKKYPDNQHEDIKERLKYIRPYALKLPIFDGEWWVPSQDAVNYYDHRQLLIESCGLSEVEFNEFDILQGTIADLGLSPKATFDFIAFIWHKLYTWLYNGKLEPIGDRINQLMARIDERPNDSIELDIKIGGRHFKFADQTFIKSFISSYINADLETSCLTETIYPTKREIDYILVRTILQYLPIKHKKDKKGTFSQAERNLGLCVLWLTGELNHRKGDDPTEYCTKNNATFDKLMRDFSTMQLPIISLHSF